MTSVPDRIRIPRHALAAWARVRTKLRDDLEQHRIPGDEGPITDARIAASMIALCESVLKVGPGIILDPELHGFYEAPPEDPPDMPEFIHDLQVRIDKLERAAFWRRLEDSPPKDGTVPILPSFEWLEEAAEKFPHLYGPEADKD